MKALSIWGRLLLSWIMDLTVLMVVYNAICFPSHQSLALTIKL